MKKIGWTAAALFALLGVGIGADTAPSTMPSTAPQAACTVPATLPGGYRLVWSEEFEGEGALDPKDWSFERGFVRNQELQWYQPDNASRKKGMLVIEGRREEKPNPNFRAGSTDWKTSRQTSQYTSSSATTANKHEWLYGRFEMRAKIDVQAGSWPAFWFLGKGSWPAGGEVDVMEFYKGTLLANLVWVSPTGGQQWNTVKKPLTDPRFGKGWSEQFHVWRMDWDEARIALYVDDVLINEQDLTKTLNRGREGDNPFHRPMYLLLNQAIGANGGDPAASNFPLRFEVDYVRVYQKDTASATQPATRPAP